MKNFNCAQCGKEFKAKRNDAKYCGTACRVKAHSKRHPERFREKNTEYVRNWRNKQKANKLSLEDSIVKVAQTPEPVVPQSES